MKIHESRSSRLDSRVRDWNIGKALIEDRNSEINKSCLSEEKLSLDDVIDEAQKKKQPEKDINVSSRENELF